jgi:hypothetical protein
MAPTKPPITSFEEFKKRLLALSPEDQDRVLKKAFDLAYEKLDDQVWRTIATAIKHAKETGLEGHENFKIEEKDLKKLTHIQDTFRRKGH